MSAPAVILVLCAVMTAGAAAAAAVLMPPPQEEPGTSDGEGPSWRSRIPWTRCGCSFGSLGRLEPPQADDVAEGPR